jgi:tRNA pseudouridine55 synthase
LIERTLTQFLGEIQQVPPQYSAVKIDGKRAYHLMRKGNEVELKPKTVRVDEIELTSYDAEKKQASIRVVCGKGTYIRSLARDIGEALGSGAYLTALCRTRLGDVRLDDCITIEDFPQWLDSQEIELS